VSNPVSPRLADVHPDRWTDAEKQVTRGGR